MNKFALAIHGGCGNSSPFIKKNMEEIKDGLQDALSVGFHILKKGGSALNAVCETVMALEDNYLFNAGCGSALNNEGKVEMDASIMDGKKIKAGAVSMVRSVKNPIVLARDIMEKTKHVFLSGYGALEFAKDRHLELKPDSYFITEHQLEDYERANKIETKDDIRKKKSKGTVGAVAIDKFGNLASATSTGGTPNSMPGRVGDSCVIGAGCYANNDSCAVSGTGDGEFLITGAVAHTIAMLVEIKKWPIQKACDYVVKKRNAHVKGMIGIVSIDKKGKVGISFNTKVMKRGFITQDGCFEVGVY